jgi:hypothetical protein
VLIPRATLRGSAEFGQREANNGVARRPGYETAWSIPWE